MKKAEPADYQAIVAAPGFNIGIRCAEMEILGFDYLAAGPELAPRTGLAAEAMRQLEAYLADADCVFSLPLRPSGTGFQRRVWAAIAAIPPHETKSYGEVARALHSGPRAVGQACGANPFPLVVPCHRVIAAKGELGGFGGSSNASRQGGGFLLDVKRWLLAHERR